MKIRYGGLGFCLFLLLTACGTQQKAASWAQKNRYTVHRESLQKSLYFTGSIQPLQEHSLVSPLDAVITAMPTQFGEEVRQKDWLFTLESSELQKQFNDNLTDYLKAKDSFSIAQAKFSGADDLWQAGLIPRNQYVSEKSSLDNAHISLLQSQEKFAQLLEKMGENSSSWTHLRLENFEEVRKILQQKHHQIRLQAPSDGILLYPPKTSDQNNAKTGVGSAVKSGEALALIGDVTGVRVEIEVPEIDIDKIHRGMKANIRLAILGEEELQGKLVSMNGQASGGAGNALPVFHAMVVVPHLTEQQKQRLRIGMTANVEIALEEYQPVMVPLQALLQEGNKTLVQVLAKGKKVEKRRIHTGPVQGEMVVVLGGLQEGEELLLREAVRVH